ncbi:50S ribosomal protein L29 [bacterium]|mgnify:CR=1 FL=1|nr:MAG: 50S ribosomal protein L29 [bacterium]
MSTTKTWQLREMSRDELAQRKHELEEEHFNLRMQVAISTLKNPRRLREIRKEIARINTILHEDDTGIRKIGVSNL